MWYKTRKEYRDAWDASAHTVPPVPLNVDLELSAACNLRCPFCFLSDKSYRRPADLFMPTDLAVEIINQAASIGVPALKFNWRGEPTMHHDFSKIVQYAAGRLCFHDLLVNTNGAGPDRALAGLYSCTKVAVSVDSFDATTNHKMRFPGNLQRAIRTIEWLVSHGHDNVWVRRVITGDNKDDDFKEDARRLFGDAVHVSEHYCFGRANADNHDKRGLARLFCGYPNQRLVVDVSGKAHPCCIDYNDRMVVGDITKDGLDAIWTGPRMAQVRSVLKDGPTPAQCLNCTSWMAYDAPERAAVKDVDL